MLKVLSIDLNLTLSEIKKMQVIKCYVKPKGLTWTFMFLILAQEFVTIS